MSNIKIVKNDEKSMKISKNSVKITILYLIKKCYNIMVIYFYLIWRH